MTIKEFIDKWMPHASADDIKSVIKEFEDLVSSPATLSRAEYLRLRRHIQSLPPLRSLRPDDPFEYYYHPDEE